MTLSTFLEQWLKLYCLYILLRARDLHSVLSLSVLKGSLGGLNSAMKMMPGYHRAHVNLVPWETESTLKTAEVENSIKYGRQR